MSGVFFYVTQICNQTEELLQFLDSRGETRLRALPPHKDMKVKLRKILGNCHKYGFTGSKIDIVIQNKVSGIQLCPDHILNHTRIVIRSKRIADDLYSLSQEGIRESTADFFLRLPLFCDYIGNRFWDVRNYTAIASVEITLSKVAEDLQLQKSEVPELARDEGLQQISQRRQGGTNDHQSLTREYTWNPDDQISHSSSTTTVEEIINHSLIIPLRRRENMLVEDDPNNITGNQVETVGSDGITRAAATPAPRQETIRGSNSTEIVGQSKIDGVDDLGGISSQRFSELDLQAQSERELMLINELNLEKSKYQELSRQMEAAFYGQYISRLSTQQYPTQNRVYRLGKWLLRLLLLKCHFQHEVNNPL